MSSSTKLPEPNRPEVYVTDMSENAKRRVITPPLPPAQQIMRTLAQFQGNWVYVEQMALLGGISEECCMDSLVDLDVVGLIELREKSEGRFVVNLTDKGASTLGMVRVDDILRNPDDPFTPRNYLNRNNVRWLGHYRFVFDGPSPEGCIMCGGQCKGNNAFCVICEPAVTAQRQVPLVRPKAVHVNQQQLGPRRARLAAKKLKRG